MFSQRTILENILAFKRTFILIFSAFNFPQFQASLHTRVVTLAHSVMATRKTLKTTTTAVKEVAGRKASSGTTPTASRTTSTTCSGRRACQRRRRRSTSQSIKTIFIVQSRFTQMTTPSSLTGWVLTPYT